MYFWFFLCFSHMLLNVFLFNFCFHALWSVYVSKVKLTIQTNQFFFYQKSNHHFLTNYDDFLATTITNEWTKKKKFKFKQIYIFLLPIWPWINDSHVYFFFIFLIILLPILGTVKKINMKIEQNCLKCVSWF